MKRLLATMSFLFVLFICASSGASAALSKTLTVASICADVGEWSSVGDQC